MVWVFVMGILFADSLYFLFLIIPLTSKLAPKYFRLPKAEGNILKILQPSPIPPKKEKGFKKL